MYRHILIPTDGSDLARHALTNGLSLAKLTGAKVTVLVVEEPFDVFALPDSHARQLPKYFAKHAEETKRHAEKVLSEAAAEARAAGVPCETLMVEHEQPFEAIVETAREKGCDLIVMATHGRTGLAAVVYGSVTGKVLTRTETPVLVCH